MRRRQFVSLLGGAALAPFTALSAGADPAAGCGVPLARDDGWAVASVSDDKPIDRDALCKMADRLAADTSVHAVVVARGGKLLFERYFKGDDEIPGRIYGHRVENVTFDSDTLHDLKSVSKSVASLAVGIAIDRGLIPSVNEPIFNFFPELSDLRSPEKDRIQLVHALTMSMGLKWVEATPATGDDDNDEARMHMASDQCRYVLGLPVTASAGQEFYYNTAALALVSAIIRKATGRRGLAANVIKKKATHPNMRNHPAAPCARGFAVSFARSLDERAQGKPDASWHPQPRRGKVV
jgi:CubicO group peptidase (beta-lactamase class C family)